MFLISKIIFFIMSWLFAAFTLIPIIVLKFMLKSTLKGIPGLLIKLGIGFGAAFGAAAVSGSCPQLGLVLIVFAIIMGEFFGTLGAFLGPRLPWIGSAIEPAVAPISGSLYILLILTLILFILHILSILAIIPIIGTIILIADLVIPLIIIAIIWSSYTGAIGGISDCIGGGLISIPGIRGDVGIGI